MRSLPCLLFPWSHHYNPFFRSHPYKFLICVSLCSYNSLSTTSKEGKSERDKQNSWETEDKDINPSCSVNLPYIAVAKFHSAFKQKDAHKKVIGRRGCEDEIRQTIGKEEKKEEIWLSPMTKAPTPTEKLSKNKWNFSISFPFIFHLLTIYNQFYFHLFIEGTLILSTISQTIYFQFLFINGHQVNYFPFALWMEYK